MLLGLIPFGPARAQPVSGTTIELDGHRDSAYTLLAQDPLDDLGDFLADDLSAAWTDLSSLYVTHDETYLYIYVDLPAYSQNLSSGEIGLALDLTGDLPGSGGSTDPWTNAITFAYTATQANVGQAPVSSANVILPDVVIRGRIAGVSDHPPDDNDGWTELRRWSNGAWQGATVNWGGLVDGELVGANIAYANGEGVELRIPYADLAVPAGSTLNLQFYTTQRRLPDATGAFDTLPSDVQASALGQDTALRRLATYPPPLPELAFSQGNYEAVEGSYSVPITVTLSSPAPFTVTASYEALGLSAGAADFVPATGQVTFPPGTTLAAFQVALLGDSEPEPDETVSLSLDEPNGAVLGTPGAATLTIIDNSDGWPTLYLPLVQRQE